MKKWYKATCVIRLGRALTIKNDSHGQVSSETAKGYVIVIGVTAADIAEAASIASNIALKACNGPGEGSELEEIQIVLEPLSEIKQQLKVAIKTNNGYCYYRSGISYYTE